MKRILLSFACNDPDNGDFTGRCGAIDLHIGNECAADLDCGIGPRSRCPKLSICSIEGERWVKISRQKFGILSYGRWHGNWCWDAVRVSPAVAASVLNYLRELKWHNE